MSPVGYVIGSITGSLLHRRQRQLDLKAGKPIDQAPKPDAPENSDDKRTIEELREKLRLSEVYSSMATKDLIRNGIELRETKAVLTRLYNRLLEHEVGKTVSQEDRKVIEAAQRIENELKKYGL